MMMMAIMVIHDFLTMMIMMLIVVGIRRAVKKGFSFNLMVVGEAGLGETSNPIHCPGSSLYLSFFLPL